jgi:NADH:ubiquinone oxidoreductase subunit K
VTTALNLDNLLLLSLSLFFLMFSAAEIAMGIGLIVVQHRFFFGSDFFSTPGFNFFISQKS